MPATLGTTAYPAWETDANGIQYVEYPMHPREQWANDGCQFTRRLGCFWSDRYEFMQDILGTDYYTAGQSLINRNLAQADKELVTFYPDSMVMVDAQGYAIPNSAGYLKFVDDPSTPGGDPTEGIAVYDVVYRKPLYPVKSDEDVEGSLGPEFDRFVVPYSSETAGALPLPIGFLVARNSSGDFEEIGTSYAILFPKANLVYRWLRVPPAAYPAATIAGMIGKTNSLTFDGKAAHHLQFQGTTKRLYQGNNGITYLDIDIVMEQRPLGFDVIPTPSGEFVTAYRKGDPQTATPGDTILEEDDFYLIFDPSAG